MSTTHRTKTNKEKNTSQKTRKKNEKQINRDQG